jgi:DHA1 family bicyclomycin/chloramphenicol resistance-like MFS transporter
MIAPDSRAFILLLGAVAMLTSLAVDMSLPTLPSLATDFAASPETVQLTLSLFFIGYAAGQLLYGPVSDRFGRRRVLLGGLGLFTLAGFLCAASWRIDALIAFRLVHGLSAASGPVLARAVVRDHFGGARAAQGLSAVLAVMSVAPLVAPYLGGLLLTFFGWRTVFLTLGFLGLALLAVTWTGLAESLKHPDAQALHPWRLIANYRSFFTSPISLGYTFVNAIGFFGLFAFISGSPFVLIEVYGVRSDRFGIYYGLTALGLTLGSIANSRLVRRFSIDGMITLGFVILLAAGAALVAAGWMRWGGPWGITLPLTVFSFGLALLMPNATAAAIEPLPHMAGTAVSILGATQMATASIAGYIVNRLYDRTPMPMAWCILLPAAAAFALYLLFVRRKA